MRISCFVCNFYLLHTINYTMSLHTTMFLVCKVSFPSLFLSKRTCVTFTNLSCALAIMSPVTITTSRPIEEREAVYRGVRRCQGDRTNVLQQQVLNWPRSSCCPGDLELRRAQTHILQQLHLWKSHTLNRIHFSFLELLDVISLSLKAPIGKDR